MAQRLKESETLQAGLRRVAVEDVDIALAALDSSEGRDVTIHAIRKQCKKSRALLRLFRYGLGPAWRRELRFFRDLSRSLSAMRDGKVALDVHADLLDRFGALLEPTAGAEVRQQLIADMQALGAGGAVAAAPDVDALRQCLLSARLRARRWKLHGEAEAQLKRGFIESYRRGRRTMRQATQSRASGDFHEARKRAKDYWYELELVARCWPDAALQRIAPARRLTEVLGELHDLEIYLLAIARSAVDRSPRAVEILSALAEHRGRALEAEALEIGREVYRVKPKRFAAELQRSRERRQAAG